jgi:predicted esterase
MIHKFKIQKTNRVIVLGEPSKAKTAIMALHGYGQLVTFFQRRFKELDLTSVCVLMPEGMHRFYLNGTEGRVGASWMTKEEREDDIQDNNVYLEAVFEEFLAPYQFEKLVVLGFSQGCPTAIRWMTKTKVKVDAFIQWAGVFPPDVEANLVINRFKDKQLFLVIGDEDPYFEGQNQREDRIAEYLELGLDVEFVSFAGKHHIDSQCLTSILEKLG